MQALSALLRQGSKQQASAFAARAFGSIVPAQDSNPFLRFSSPFPKPFDHSPLLATLPETQVTTLPNGLRVATEHIPFAETTTLGVWINSGSRFETDETNGVAHFLEHILFKGTNKRTVKELEVEVENMGGQLNAYTGREQTAYYAKVLGKDVGKAVGILSDILLNSNLDERAINKERDVILREMEEVGIMPTGGSAVPLQPFADIVSPPSPAIGGAWIWFVWTNRQHSHRIHYLMGLLCLFKALTVMSQAGMFHYVERTGHADGWNIAYYIFTFCRGVLFFTVVVLIGTGWSYMKPFLGDKEKRILMVVIPLQVFANIAIIITEEESPAIKDWFTWRDVFHLVDIICCCAILFPIVWSIKHLREASQTDGKAARNLEKLTLFRQFYVMVVVYIYFTRIVVYLLMRTMQYDYAWVSEAADQLATLAFYVWTAVKFRPQPNNPYLKLETAEIEL